MKTKTWYEVTYYSPGTFFAESTKIKFDKLDYKNICDKAKSIKERYGATPYGFTWIKYEMPVDIPTIEGYTVKVDPKILEKSAGDIFITGEVILSKNLVDDKDKILKSNLECNNGGVGVINCNSYKFHSGFNKEDIIIDWNGNVLTRGDDKKLVNYRKNYNK